MKSPPLACFCSILVPGLGQIYLEDYAKGLTLLCMAVGILVSVLLSHSWFVRVLMGLVYLTVVFPAAVDAFQTAAGKPRVFSGSSVMYVLLMLFMVGPFAIPLLWQSPKFSKTAKVVWTVLVVLMAFVAIAVTTFLASSMDAFVQQNTTGVGL